MNPNDLPLAVREPMVGICRNPLLLTAEVPLETARVGTSLLALRPHSTGPVRCLLNGQACYPITPRQWQHHLRLGRAGRADEARRYLGKAVRRAAAWRRLTLQPGDVLIWHVVPQDRDTLRTIVAVVVAAIYLYFTWDANGALTLANFGTALSLGIAVSSLLVPVTADAQAQQQGGSIYSTSLTGNQAKLDQPIWRNCGIVKITPPFACQPYYEYVDTDGDNADNDQFYYVVFAVGIGRHDVLNAMIGKTPIGHFQDVLVAEYLPPGTPPARVLCNVVTSGEVSTLELDTARYVGGYVACQPGRRCSFIGVDVACPQGLGKAGDLTVTWQIEWREIDDFGRPASPWALLATETRTANTNTPQRWSGKYSLPGAARPEVRLVRTDVKDTGTAARHMLQWIGLRGYLTAPAPLNPNVGHFEVVMRASEQLSAQSQRDFSLIVQAYARTWSAGAGWSCALHDWPNYTATRNPAWYLADLWVDPLWGEGRDEAHIDLAGIVAFAAVNAERQDRFDHTFAESMNAMDAAQLIAATGRARAFERLGVLSLARDALVTLPRTAFSPRNTLPNSMAVTEMTPRAPAIVDGIVLEYVSNITWDIVPIECPCPGFTVSDDTDPRHDPALPPMTRPLYMRVEGIKGAKHAERTGLYEAAKRLLRRRVTSCTTTMQGAVLSFFEAVRWQPEIGGFGQSGDVASWDVATLTLGLTEPLAFSDTGSTWLAIMRDDGTLTTPVRVIPGALEHEVILPAAPDFDLVLDDATRERPKFFAGTSAVELMRITSIEDGGRGDAEEGEEGVQLYDITGFIDDARVHSADRHLLPGPGEEQDPLYTPDDTTGGGSLYLVDLSDQLVYVNGDVSEASSLYQLTNYGGARTETVAPNSATAIPREWMRFGGLTVAEAEMYEVRFTYLGGYGGAVFGRFGPVYHETLPPNGGDAFDTWLSLGTTRGVSLAYTGGTFIGAISALRAEIRDVASGVVQGAANVTLQVSFEPPDSTGG